MSCCLKSGTSSSLCLGLLFIYFYFYSFCGTGVRTQADALPMLRSFPEEVEGKTVPLPSSVSGDIIQGILENGMLVARSMLGTEDSCDACWASESDR
jgi:hypothetical protein